jgi:transcriptional regulator with XRE-family HTH domain
MNSVDRVKKICKERKIPISRLERDLGFSNGYIGQLRKGVFPSDRLTLIADYLNVSVDYLMTGTDENGLTEKDNRDIAKDMEAIRSKLMNGSDGPLSYDGEPIPEEDAELLLGQIELMMRRLKPINKEKYNPNKNKK